MGSLRRLNEGSYVIEALNLTKHSLFHIAKDCTANSFFLKNCKLRVIKTFSVSMEKQMITQWCQYKKTTFICNILNYFLMIAFNSFEIKTLPFLACFSEILSLQVKISYTKIIIEIIRINQNLYWKKTVHIRIENELIIYPKTRHGLKQNCFLT